MKVIEAKGLSKAFRNVTALNRISIEIEENKITGLIGRNGAGKTTFLKIIAGLIKETSGDVKVFSEHPFNNLNVSANVIFIHNKMNLPSALTLKEILTAAASFYKNWNRELAQRLLDYFSLHPLQNYEGLSMGMKSTFGIILGISSRCPLTIFDEPTNGMDASVRKDFYRALLKDYIACPRSIILSSHHLNEIEDLIEDILLMKDGKELLHMPVSDLKEWAVGIQGNDKAATEWAMNKEIIHTKDIGLGRTYIVVKNNLSEKEINAARLAGLEVSSVPTSDLCVYLTGKTRGGIDDVFIKG
jgi:ABC-2 type transport system ATP-binding protein